MASCWAAGEKTSRKHRLAQNREAVPTNTGQTGEPSESSPQMRPLSQFLQSEVETVEREERRPLESCRDVFVCGASVVDSHMT